MSQKCIKDQLTKELANIMNYIASCLTFMNEEKKSCRKEVWRLLNLKESDHNDEGQTVVNAKAIKKVKEGTLFSFPAQYTKLREEKRVELYDNKQLISDEAEIVSIDYLKQEFVLDIDITIGRKFLIIQSLEVSPFAIINSLKKLQLEGNELSSNLMKRNSNVKTFGESSIKNFTKTCDLMNNSFIVIQGPPGAGKSYSGRAIINHLLKNNKTIAISSNSHSAINNLCEEIDYKKFKGAKICSKSNHQIKHELIENIYVEGKEIDRFVEGYDLVAGTCFALSRVQNKKYDFLIIDEASQLKMSFLLSISRIAHNVIILGDQNQLQSISVIPMASGGESVLDYILQGKKVVPQELGYFLNVTYRMEPKIASIISDVFYESKLGWNQKKKLHGVTLVSSNHSHGQKMSKEEADDVILIYNSLRKKKVKAEDIMVVTPYNAQAALIKGLIDNPKIQVGTVDLFQGREARFVIISCVAAGNKKESSEFATNPNRLNVAISRAKEGVFLVASNGLQKSEHTSLEFKTILNKIAA